MKLAPPAVRSVASRGALAVGRSSACAVAGPTSTSPSARRTKVPTNCCTPSALTKPLADGGAISGGVVTPQTRGSVNPSVVIRTISPGCHCAGPYQTSAGGAPSASELMRSPLGVTKSSCGTNWAFTCMPTCHSLTTLVCRQRGQSSTVTCKSWGSTGGGVVAGDTGAVTRAKS